MYNMAQYLIITASFYSFMIKKAATISTPTQEVTDLGGGKWKLVTATTLKSMTTEFEFDKAFDEKASTKTLQTLAVHISLCEVA